MHAFKQTHQLDPHISARNYYHKHNTYISIFQLSYDFKKKKKEYFEKFVSYRYQSTKNGIVRKMVIKSVDIIGPIQTAFSSVCILLYTQTQQSNVSNLCNDVERGLVYGGRYVQR